MSSCPRCGGVLQEFQTLDVDDKIVKCELKCKGQPYFNKKRKGCGYYETKKDTPHDTK